MQLTFPAFPMMTSPPLVLMCVDYFCWFFREENSF